MTKRFVFLQYLVTDEFEISDKYELFKIELQTIARKALQEYDRPVAVSWQLTSHVSNVVSYTFRHDTSPKNLSNNNDTIRYQVNNFNDDAGTFANCFETLKLS